MAYEHGKFKVVIYALCEPLTLEIRYIGQSIDPTKRLYGHIHATCHNRRKREWIADLQSRGLTPWMVIIENTDAEQSNEREYFWLCHYLKLGTDLLNGPFHKDFTTKRLALEEYGDDVPSWLLRT